MAKLYLKRIMKPLTIQKSTAVTINKILDDDSIDKFIQFNFQGIRFCKDDVKHVIEDDAEDDGQTIADERKQENEEYYNKANIDFKQNIQRLCKRSIDDKANDVKLFTLVYHSISGFNPDQETIDKVIEVQREYFTKNPSHPYARINMFQFIKNFPQTKEGYSDMKVGVATFGIRFFDRILSEAFREAHYQKLI